MKTDLAKLKGTNFNPKPKSKLNVKLANDEGANFEPEDGDLGNYTFISMTKDAVINKYYFYINLFPFIQTIQLWLNGSGRAHWI